MPSATEWKAFLESSDKTVFADKLAAMESTLGTLQPTGFRIARYIAVFLGKSVIAVLAVLAFVGLSQEVLLKNAVESMLPELIEKPITDSLPALVSEPLRTTLPDVLREQLPEALRQQLSIVSELNRLKDEAQAAHDQILSRNTEVDALLTSWKEEAAGIASAESRSGLFRDVGLVWRDESRYPHVSFVVPVRMPTADYTPDVQLTGDDVFFTAYTFEERDAGAEVVIRNTRFVRAHTYFVVTFDIENPTAQYVVGQFKWTIPGPE